jgi:hypothetical protein
LFHPGMVRDPAVLEEKFKCTDHLLRSNWRKNKFVPLENTWSALPVPLQQPQPLHAIFDPMDEDLEDEVMEHGSIPAAVVSNAEEIVLKEDPMVL